MTDFVLYSSDSWKEDTAPICPITKALSAGNNSLVYALLFSCGLHILLTLVITYVPVNTSISAGVDAGTLNVVMLNLASPIAGTEIISDVVTENDSFKALTEVDVTPQPTEKIITEKPSKVVDPVVKKKAISKKTSANKSIKKHANNNQENNLLSSTQHASDERGSQVQANMTGKKEGGMALPINRTNPSYPERARALGIEGKVTVKFDVDKEGRVHNIHIISANPEHLFERTVKQAMRRWRYQPKVSHGLVVTIIFNLEGKIDMH